MIKEWEFLKETFDFKLVLTAMMVLILAIVVIVIVNKVYTKFKGEDEEKEVKIPRHLESLALYLKDLKKGMWYALVIAFISLLGFSYFAIGGYFVAAGFCMFNMAFWLLAIFLTSHERTFHPQAAYEEAIKSHEEYASLKQTDWEQANKEKEKSMTLDDWRKREERGNLAVSFLLFFLLMVMTVYQFPLYFLIPFAIGSVITIEWVFARQEEHALREYEDAQATVT